MAKIYLLPKYERQLLKTSDYRYVVGIDEVGRGCWAGPVAVGAFRYDLTHKTIHGIHDSKKLTAEQRESVYEKLNRNFYKVEFGEVEMINKSGIGKTITYLIDKILEALPNKAETMILVDGQFAKDFGINSTKIIKGDATYYSIAAASILAKVERDRLMIKLHEQYPEYLFNKNKGYATLAHRKILNKVGPSEIHRKSFLPIKSLLEGSQLTFA